MTISIERLCVIQRRDGAYWGPNRGGYVAESEPWLAGVYPCEEAARIVQNVRAGEDQPDKLVPVRIIRARLATIRDGISKWERELDDLTE
jgi:hypothetical protein